MTNEIKSTGRVFTPREVYDMFKDDPHYEVFLAFGCRDNRVDRVVELALNGYTLKELSDIALYSEYVGMDNIACIMWQAEKAANGDNWNTYTGCYFSTAHPRVSYFDIMKAKGRDKALAVLAKWEEDNRKMNEKHKRIYGD